MLMNQFVIEFLCIQSVLLSNQILQLEERDTQKQKDTTQCSYFRDNGSKIKK